MKKFNIKWLTEDFSDFYIEEEVEYNPFGERIRSRFLIRYAYYNSFGIKRYKRVTHAYVDECSVFTVESAWSTKGEALAEWKSKVTTKEIIRHTVCNKFSKDL
jgi:hypothetical protein